MGIEIVVEHLDMELEDRKYGEDSTPQEVDAIKERVFVYESNVVVLRQMSQVSIYATELLFEQVKFCTKELDSFSLIIDLSNVNSSDPEYRSVLKKRFQELTKLKRVAIITKKYSVLWVTARFISLSAGLKEFVVRDNFDQALEYVTSGK